MRTAVRSRRSYGRNGKRHSSHFKTPTSLQALISKDSDRLVKSTIVTVASTKSALSHLDNETGDHAIEFHG